MALDLEQEVFQPVVARVRKRSDSLRNIWKFPKVGIEGWLKVEVVAALGGKVTSVRNKGIDLPLNGGTNIELKAATSPYTNWFKYDVPVLFLSGRASRESLAKNIPSNLEVVGSEEFSDGANHWLLGMVKPKDMKE